MAGGLTEERVAILSDVVTLAADAQTLVELQLDLKAYASLADTALASLAAGQAVGAARARQQHLGSGASPTARGGARPRPGLRPSAALGCGSRPWERASRYLSRTGDYGYLDDHPLAADRWGTACEYLAARAEVLWRQAPVSMWYVRATLLARMLEDGFDWIADLHRRGAQVAAWTLNPDRPHHLGLAAELIERGVDRITTDDAEGLAATLPD